jgi:hypothetical protein
MYSENPEEEIFVQRMIGKIGSTQFFITIFIIIIICSFIYFIKVYSIFSNPSKHVHFSDELIIDG